MKFTIKGISFRQYEIYDSNNVPLGMLNYPSWMTYRKATITCAGKTYDLAPAGIFSRQVVISESGNRIGAVAMKGFSGIHISRDGGATYIVKRVGLFNSHMGLFTENKQEIAKATLANKWAFRRLTYNIETDDNYTEDKDLLLLLLIIYCTNTLRAAHAT